MNDENCLKQLIVVNYKIVWDGEFECLDECERSK